MHGLAAEPLFSAAADVFNEDNFAAKIGVRRFAVKNTVWQSGENKLNLVAAKKILLLNRSFAWAFR
jgi:hypothetical protein